MDEIENKRGAQLKEPEPDPAVEDEEAEARRQYQAGWWQRNGVLKRQARRERYQNDPEYRQQCIARAEAYRQRRIDEGHSHKDVQGRQLTVQVGSERLPAFTATTLARQLGRTLQAINNWQNRGMLPDTPIHSDGGARLYTQAMMDVVEEALNECDNRRVLCGDMEFYKRVEKGWKKLGIFRKKTQHVA